jgi:hypothetical protein
MNEKISVKDFVEGYEKCAIDSLKDRYIKEKVKVVQYVPYLTKVALAENIVKQSSYARNEEGKIEQPERIKVNSALRYVLFVTTVIKTYTNIDFDGADMMTGFDTLNECGLVEAIFEKIAEKELAEFRTVLDMALEDFMVNEYETHTFISRQVTRVTDVLGVFLEPLLPTLKELSKKLDEMDKQGLKKVNNKIAKMVNTAIKQIR